MPFVSTQESVPLVGEEGGSAEDVHNPILDGGQPGFGKSGRWQRTAGGLLITGALLLFALGASKTDRHFRGDAAIDSVVNLNGAYAGDDPNWGCGLVGALPGITQDGIAAAPTQALIDGMKASSTFNKASYWNWNLAPQTEKKTKEEHLTADFIFHPEQWGAAALDPKYVRQAGVANFLDSNGKTCPATMGELFLGMNEPDIKGSCMGNMFGECGKPCSDASVAAGQCPAAHLGDDLPRAHANAQGECNCWQFSVATGVGFWPLPGCAGMQPLPTMWSDAGCVNTVMGNWKKTAQIAVSKGYKYLTTPLVAVDIGYAKKFIEHACGCTNGVCACTDASCGCPVYIGFHFYAYDCRPDHSSGYTAFQEKVEHVAQVMEQYPFVKGAIINEVGMLNCRPVDENPICVPDSGHFPASSTADGGCPNDGLATYINKLFDIVIAAKTSDGRSVVKTFSWFNENKAGGTYNLQLFTPDGSLNAAGEAYAANCRRWGNARR